MNRLFTLIAIALAGLLAGCGSSVSSSTQAGTTGGLVDVYTIDVTPVQFSLNSGDFASVTAVVEVSKNNGAAVPVLPQPAFQFFSSDPRVSVSPAGEVCAGLWDSRYITCTPIPAGTPLPKPGDSKNGFVTITAYNASHNVSGTTLVSVHPRAINISLSAPVFTGAVSVSVVNGQPVSTIPLGQYPSTTGCVSQNNFALVGGSPVINTQVQYVAAALDVNAIPIPRCSTSPGPGCINDNDYTWTTDNSNVAQASSFGVVAARNPGVTNVFANLNGTISQPLAFVTCPPTSIVLSTSPFTGTILPPTPPTTFTTADHSLDKGGQENVNATLIDRNGLPLVISPLTYITSDPLTGSFGTAQGLSSVLTADTAGRFTMMAACEPAACNPAVADFTSPAGPQTGQLLGFGFPIYSNVIGATVHGITGSSVLVTGVTNSDGVTPAHRLLVYDSESLALTETVALANVPNSLVIAPNGAEAYLGSSAGLMVVNLTTFQSTLRDFPIAGGLSTDVVTGTVLGVSPDSRFVLLSDVANSFVFLIDTTGTKVAQRFILPNITSVTFAADGSNTWIGSNAGVGNPGVYVLQADTFVPTAHDVSSNVNSLAWMPDGQSYFASGDQLANYSTCQDQNLPLPGLTEMSSVPGGLFTTALSPVAPLPGDVSHLLGLNGSTWFDYSVFSRSEVPNQSVLTLSALVTGGATGDVCPPPVSVNPPVLVTFTVNPALPCPAQQLSFAPTLEQEFVTGVSPSCASPESVIHGYDVVLGQEISLTTTNKVIPLSGGVLNDGRKLYFGSADSTNGALLHRIDLATGTGTPGTLTEDDSASVSLIPSFVAVVPK